MLRLCLQRIINTNNICILLTIYQNPYQYEVRTGKPGLHKKLLLHARAFFNYITWGAKSPPPSPHGGPPTQPFCPPPSQSPFSL